MLISHSFIFYEEIPIQIFGPFLMGYCLTESLKLFIYSDYKSFIKYITYKYCLPSVGVLFSFLMVFLCPTSFNFDKVQSTFFSFAFGVISKKPLSNFFSCQNFRVSALTFKYLIHFELMCIDATVVGRKGSAAFFFFSNCIFMY